MKIACPCLKHRVATYPALPQHPAVDEPQESRDSAVSIPNDGEHFRLLDPPAVDDRRGVRALMASRNFSNGGTVVGPGGLDGQLLHVAGEERLAHNRVIDQVEHVGCGLVMHEAVRDAPQMAGREGST
jgi:hypothetical protein